MPWNRRLQRAREMLDQRLARLPPDGQLAIPPKGWIRALRNALGMSAAQLGERMGIRSQSLDDMEKAEQKGSITLASLRRAAAAMDCTLVYALVPKTSLEEIVHARARAIALAAIASVDQTMALEDQAVASDLERQIEDYIADHISERDLWSGR
jgi:predicted DNA-binding mobile mystery protein A